MTWLAGKQMQQWTSASAAHPASLIPSPKEKILFGDFCRKKKHTVGQLGNEEGPENLSGTMMNTNRVSQAGKSSHLYFSPDAST